MPIRKLDRLAVLEASSALGNDVDGRSRIDIQCQNCKERYTLFPKKGDDNNLQCANCGQLLPIRSIRQGRGLATPSIQQKPSLPQSEELKKKAGRTRTPKSINNATKERSEIEQSLIDKGYEIIDSTNYH